MNLRGRHGLVALIVAGVLAVSACGSQPPGDSAAPTTASDKRDAETVDLEFSATTLDGKDFEGTSLAGKPALLWFWGPWCPTCAAQGPDVNRIAKTHGDAIDVVGVGGLDKTEAMDDFVDRTKPSKLSRLADESGEVWKHFGITEQSTYVLIDADGRLVHSGYLGGGQLTDKIEKLT